MKYEEIQADTTEEISQDSARKLISKIGAPFFIEDTGLYIISLRGFPGPYSSYVQSTLGNQGILLLMGGKDPTAFFLTVITYFDGKRLHQFPGKLQGKISSDARGEKGFGYDPIFIPAGHKMTLAEMSIEEKNKISHRSIAVREFLRFLNGIGEQG